MLVVSPFTNCVGRNLPQLLWNLQSTELIIFFGYLLFYSVCLVKLFRVARCGLNSRKCRCHVMYGFGRFFVCLLVGISGFLFSYQQSSG